MKFKISSGLKDNIGRELITDDNVAILELVKNSYDAGARTVKIIFQDMNHQYDSRISIVDDGKGMSKKDIENKWLFVGYSEKKDLKILKGKRRMAGQKGIGRFSCDRLGERLKITTKAPTDKHFNVLELNWKNFEKDQNKEFQSIPIEVKTQETGDKKLNFLKFSGTLVEINDLRKEWDDEKLLKLKRYLQRLINPLQMDSKDKFTIILEAKEFLSRDNKEEEDYNKVNGEIINRVYEKIGMKTTTIDCEISSDGKRIITQLNDKGIDIFKLKEKNNKFKLLQGIKIKISYLNRNARTIFSKIMGVQSTEYGNILLFKNGFRILPYGERENDWIKLNDRKAQGYNRYLGTREVFGRVEVNGDQPEFREVTSRSGGLVDTDSVKELHTFLIKLVFPRLEEYVIGAIDWDSPREKDSNKEKKSFEDIKKGALKVIESIAGNLKNKDLEYNKDFLRIIEEKTIEKIPETIKNIENISKKEKDTEIKELYSQQIKSLKQGLKLQKEKQKEEIVEKEKEIKQTTIEKEKKEEESKFLRSITSWEFDEVINYLHDIGIYSDTIEKNAERLLKELIKGETSKENILGYVEEILKENKKIISLSRYVTKPDILSHSREGSKDLNSFIKKYIKEITPIFRGKLKISIFAEPSKKFNLKFRPIQMMTILDNLINNSRKKNAKNMDITIKKPLDNQLTMSIKDDGDGLDKEIKEKGMFNKGVTSTKGSGLGLFHVKKTVEELGGKIEVNTKLKKGIEFMISFKK